LLWWAGLFIVAFYSRGGASAATIAKILPLILHIQPTNRAIFAGTDLRPMALAIFVEAGWWWAGITT